MYEAKAPPARSARPFRVTRGRLAPGDAGISFTLQRMRQLAHAGAREPAVREQAIRILREAGVTGHNSQGSVQAIFRWVRDRMTFVRDIPGVEVLQSPRYTLHVMAGDCDDYSILIAALCHAIGVPVRFVVIGADRRNPRRFSHVYPVARVGGSDIPMDAIYRKNALGWEYPSPFRRAEVPA